MGCDCCKEWTPSQYEKCQKLNAELKAKGRCRIAPCGGCEIGAYANISGSNYTPPKPKRKKKPKVRHNKKR